MDKVITAQGVRNTRLYKIWKKMKSRTINPNDISWKYYGAKGVTCCEEWKTFITFKIWAMANGYQDGLELCRITANSNYEPCNCRWGTKKDQYKARSTNLPDQIGLQYGDFVVTANVTLGCGRRVECTCVNCNFTKEVQLRNLRGGTGINCKCKKLFKKGAI